MSEHEPLVPGQLIGARYRLDEQIGAGGMGQVWRAHDTVLDRAVAVKAVDLDASADLRAAVRFNREARTTAGLNHPNIVTVHDSLIEGGHALLVMELLPGPSLAEEMARGPLAVDEVQQVAEQVLSALGAAHARGIVHRDIKPANVVRGGDDRWKVVDFGITRGADEADGPTQLALTATNTIIGTADYLAPEQALGGALDGRTDLYALGCVLWALLVGEAPLRGPNALATMMRHANEDVPDVRAERPSVPASLAGLITALTARDPARRPGTATEALALLAPTHGPDGGATQVLAGGTAVTTVLPTAGETAHLPTTRGSAGFEAGTGSPGRTHPPGIPPSTPPEARWDSEAVDRDRRWGPRLVAVIVALIVGALLWNWASGRDWGTASNGAATPSASTEGTPSPDPSQTTATPPSSTPTPPPASAPAEAGADGVSVAMKALTAAVDAAEKIGAIGKDTGKALAAQAREMDKAIRSGSSSNAESEVKKLRETYDSAVADGSINGSAARALDPLMRAVETSVSRWAAAG